MYKNEKIKQVLGSKLSSDQMAFLKLIYHTLKDPNGFPRYQNAYQYDKNLLKSAKIDFVPPVFSATITDNCNLRCPNCLYLLEDPDKFFPSFIEVEKFRSILEKYNKDKKAEVIFLTGGEPLMHPNFEDLIDISRAYGLSVKISSNGILIKEKISAVQKLDYVNVSMDSHDERSFKKYRGGTPKQFEMIKEGLRILKEKGIYFSMSFILSSSNLQEADQMIALAEQFSPAFIYFHNINPHGCEQFKSLTMQDQNTKAFLEKIQSRDDYPFDITVSKIFDTESPSFREAKCIQPWHDLCFNTVGDVAYCCHLAHAPEIGNVFNDYDLNSSAMVKFREDTLAGKIPKSCLYCQRRFMGQYACRFDSKKKEWISY